uniref:Kinesin-like protein n=1 Tax=Oryza nivara TaxID=4536 RepID=A0A0E0HMJ1_ORYNI
MASRHRRGAFPAGAKAAPEAEAAKESVAVAVRFRPLSPREVRRGEKIAWYADGETVARSEQSNLAYAYDRVFGPTTTTRHIYDAVAQYVVNGAMKGINGTIFAYGVTSSGKTHTMHGDQISPGVIPLAVKDIFNIIQETPNREFLLRVSYLEIYNEVVNDLLNPAGQNLRIREDLQGTIVEGIKEEAVLSPVHALSLIAAGEELRHVGSTNFNLLSSRSHTIFTLTIESSPRGQSNEAEAVTLSQLNLIDLAGSESSRVETAGVHQKEGSYINKSLLTLGKLICTVTPASSNSEETHNTLKFAHRAKHIEIQTTQNKIMDARSLIKKYQNEIRQLKEELEQLRRSIRTGTPIEDTMQKKHHLLETKGFGEKFKSSPKEETENQKGHLNWLNLRKCDSGSTNLTSSDGENPSSTKSLPALSTPLGIGFFNVTSEQRMSDYMLAENVPANLLCVGHGEFPSDSLPVQETPLVSRKTSDHVDILREQFNILSGEVALHQSVLKRLSEEAGKNAMNEQIEMEMKVVNDEVKLNKQKIASLERRISNSMSDSRGMHDNLELSLPYIEIPEQLNEKAFQLEASECQEFLLSERTTFQHNTGIVQETGSQAHKGKPLPSDVSDEFLKKASQAEIDELKQRVSELTEAKSQLDSCNHKLLEESTYAKGLASVTSVELKALSVKVTKLMKQNERLSSELASGRNQRRGSHGPRGARRENHTKRYEPARRGDMNALEAMLKEKDQRQAELHTKIEESKQKEAFLEKELANMWTVLANLKKTRGIDQEDFDSKYNGSWA